MKLAAAAGGCPARRTVCATDSFCASPGRAARRGFFVASAFLRGRSGELTGGLAVASAWKYLSCSAIGAAFSGWIPRAPARGSALLTATARGTLEQPGCPLCHLLCDAALRSLESLLWEFVTDPNTHRVLVAARGFCFEHSWALIPASERVYSHQGIATILRRVLDDLLRVAQHDGVPGMRRWFIPQAPCPTCAQGRYILPTYGREIAHLYATQPALVGGQPALLCRPHLDVVAGWLRPPQRDDIREEIEERQRQVVAEAPLGIALETLVGDRPAYFPTEAAYCPACAREREAVGAAWLVSGGRLAAWTRYLDAPDQLRREIHAVAMDWEAPRRPAHLNGSSDVTRDAGARSPAAADLPHLCLGHLRQALAGRDAERVAWQSQAGLGNLVADLLRFEESADYRFRGTLTDDERMSWRAAIARFAGEMPEVDLHAVSHGQATAESGPGGVRALAHRLAGIILGA